MNAMLLHHPAPIDSNPLAWTPVPDPLPATDQVRVKISACALCRTDLHVVEGDLPRHKTPVIPGHQIVGRVDLLGPDCRRLRLGQRVGIAWLRSTCGQCPWCTSARENLCPYSKYTGYDEDGGYAEYALVHEDYAYEIPDGYSDLEAAPLLCAGIIGYRALKRAQLRPRAKVGIWGFGSSAHLILQVLQARGHDVFVVSRGQTHQQLACEMGAAWVGADAREMPAKVEAALVFAPVGAVVPGALAALERGGVCALAGIHMTDIPALAYDDLLFGERDLHPVTANTRDDGREFLAEAARAGVRARIKTYPLQEANQALLEMKQGKIEGTGVLVVESPRI